MEIANPEHVICTLNEHGAIRLEATVTRGRGYEPVEYPVCAEDEQETRSIGVLRLDASYSPMRRVAYSVESARVEQRTDLDKLILDIESNGTIDPGAGHPPRRHHPPAAAGGVRGLRQGTRNGG